MKSTMLREKTPDAWAAVVMADMDSFLPDHAAAEKKASSMAITMISHYPDREKLILAMADLAVEELSHYREVVRLVYQRGLQLKADTRDAYVGELRQLIRQGPEKFFLDRLLVAGVIEARGAERFGLLASNLKEPALQRFYASITRSEQRHEDLFLQLANHYFASSVVEQRLDELLDKEASIMIAQPLRPALH